ncbi:MAG: cobalt-precorrin 5A hydrolase [Pseudomonadota bacterium]
MMQRFPMDTDVQNNKQSNTLALWAITPNGKALGQKIQNKIRGAVLFVSKNSLGACPVDHETMCFENLAAEIAQQFNCFSGHVFIFSTGIAVRMIAPLLQSKTIDPAVVVVDDSGKHAISLLSGHIGGANQLTETISAIIGAQPVITTATDVNQIPAIDLIAKNLGLFIETPENIKHINMAFLMNNPVFLYDPLEYITPHLPQSFWIEQTGPMSQEKASSLTHTIFCSPETDSVPRETLILRPLVLSVGIGCNRGTSMETIKTFLELTFKAAGLSTNSILKLATVDVKKDEAGLLAMAQKMQISLDFYSRDDLNFVTNVPTPSKTVEKHLGVKSVCEAAALLSAGWLDKNCFSQTALCANHLLLKRGGLILPKQKNKDVTIAVAVIK